MPFDALEGATDGLIALTAGGEGALARLFADGQADKAGTYAGRLKALFPDRLYIELSRRGDPVEEAAEAALIDLAYALDLPLVATNPAQYAEPEFHAAHDAMLCIAGSTYVENDERPDVVARSLAQAGRGDGANCSPTCPRRSPTPPSSPSAARLPRRSAGRSCRGSATTRTKRCGARPMPGLEQRLEGQAEEDKPAYRERLDFEIDVITRMGFAGYFLIVADFIKWAKANDIPVGPGRGSGAGSVVAWALTITDLDPIELNLLFERFLNPERVSMPDFDIDFCETHRDKVIPTSSRNMAATRSRRSSPSGG